MPEVDRATKLRVLAEKGMGWRILEEEEPVELRRTCDPPWPPKLYVYKSLGQRMYLDHWHPFTDWQAAGELLEAMRNKPDDVLTKFKARLHKMTRDWLWVEVLMPAHIAQAAYEALEGSHDPR